jgi:hypothetical protein
MDLKSVTFSVACVSKYKVYIAKDTNEDNDTWILEKAWNNLLWCSHL